MKLYEDVGALAVLALKIAFAAGLVILLILLAATFGLIQVTYWLKDHSTRIYRQLRDYYDRIK